MRGRDLKKKKFEIDFEVLYRNRSLGRIVLGMPGEHNVMNAIAAIAVGLELDIGIDVIREGLRNLGGLARRFQLKGETDDILTLDDYGHHPTEIMATLKTARECWPDRRLIVVFQPHRYSRTKELYERFVISFNDAFYHKITYVVKDAYSNISKLNFTVKSSLPRNIIEVENKKNDSLPLFLYDEENRFEKENIIAVFPKNSFYSSFNFHFKTTEAGQACISPIFHIQDECTPVHYRYKLSLKPDNLAEKYRDKAVIVQFEDNEDTVSYGGVYKDGFIETKLRSFGKFAVMLDTVPPQIKALNIHNNKKISGYHAIVIEITDELSGIKSYRGTLNGKWILMEYDAKNNRLTYFIDSHIKKGKNLFELKVADERGNESNYKANVIY